MSGQYGFRNEPGWWDDNYVWTDEWVKASDAEAAIAAAYEEGQADMLARCIAAVEASAADVTAWDYDAERALAALRALAADPCDCRAAVEHLADLEIDRMREES